MDLRKLLWVVLRWCARLTLLSVHLLLLLLLLEMLLLHSLLLHRLLLLLHLLHILRSTPSLVRRPHPEDGVLTWEALLLHLLLLRRYLTRIADIRIGRRSCSASAGGLSSSSLLVRRPLFPCLLILLRLLSVGVPLIRRQ